MNIHEYQAKSLFAKYGIPVNEGFLANSADEVLENTQGGIAEGFKFAVKAQVHAGGRGKGGGIKIVSTAEEARDAAQKIIGMQLVTPQTGSQGKPVHSVLIEKTTKIEKEFYASIILDRTFAQPCLIVSEAGGMDIEEVAATQPEKLIKKHFAPETGLDKNTADEVASRLTGDANYKNSFSEIFMAMARMFLELDISLIEINPLSIMENGEVLAIDAKINFDDNALFRHPEIAEMRDPSQEDPREIEAKKFDLSYVGLEGNIGCIVNGAGLAMATMDIIKYSGGEPANFLDVGGGASKEKVAAAFKIILQDPHVKTILVNIFGGIMRCDIVAEGILSAVKELSAGGDSPLKGMPLVVRLEGTNVKEGKEILANSGLDIISAEQFAEAAELAVKQL